MLSALAAVDDVVEMESDVCSAKPASELVTLVNSLSHICRYVRFACRRTPLVRSGGSLREVPLLLVRDALLRAPTLHSVASIHFLFGDVPFA